MAKEFDLEERTYEFAKSVRELIRKLPKTLTNREDVAQLTRCSGSVAANYIEANESLSKKDFVYRIKICRKEAKESALFLKLIFTDSDVVLENERDRLLDESVQLTKIFNKIIESSDK